MGRTKVFVGNLSFTTKEPELAAAFGVAGKVIGANIITRGTHSLGYGFVEMESEEDAENAVKLLNKKDLNGRPINVEVAKPQEENKEKGTATNGGATDKPRKPRKPGFRRRNDSDEKEQGESKGEGNNEDDRPRRKRRPRTRVRGPKTGQQAPSDVEKQESKTTLFVANLPFSLDDDGFGKIVSELGVKPKTAHVVKKRNGRSKGYGFVEFENEVDQKKALDGLNKKTVEERELSAKIALTEVNPPEKPETEEKKAAPAEKKTDKPAEKKAAPAEKKTDKPAEKKTDKPAEKKTDKPAEKKTDKTAEKKVQPVEKKESPAKTTEKK